MLPRKILLIGAATLALASCSWQFATQDAAGPYPSIAPDSTPSPTPTPSPSPTVEQVLHPLTGMPFIELASPAQLSEMPKVLAVKIDNTRNAQPQAGMGEADLVYVEEIEYGMTRLVAIFSSQIPDRIGPVRSARITDIDLLAQYGSPAFAFSGAQKKLWPALDTAPFIDISANKDPDDYSRDFDRRAPYNYFFDAPTALAQFDDISTAKEMGFTFDELTPSGGVPARSVELTWPSSTLKFRYNPSQDQYAVELNGERASVEAVDQVGQVEQTASVQGKVWADTAVIQLVEQVQSVYFDKGGGNTPQVETIGSGKAMIFRDGQLFTATWSRPDALSGTTFTNAAGNPVPFHPGHTWIALYSNDRTVEIKGNQTISAQ